MFLEERFTIYSLKILKYWRILICIVFFQETIIANGGDSAVDFFGNGLLDGRELDLSTSVSTSRHYKYISLILAAVALFFLSLCVAAFITWRRYVKFNFVN
jgi:hypothetical protein